MSDEKRNNGFRIVDRTMRRAAAYVQPLAKRSSTAAKHRVRAARGQLAPRIERTGHALEETVAPKVASYLSTAARRVAPDVPRPSRWRAPSRMAGLAAAAGAAVAVVRHRQKPQSAGSPNGTGQAEESVTDTTE